MTQQDSYEMIRASAYARLGLAEEAATVGNYRAIEAHPGPLSPEQRTILQTFWGYAADPHRAILVAQEDIALIELHAPAGDGGCKVDRAGYMWQVWPCPVARSMGRRYGIYMPDPPEWEAPLCDESSQGHDCNKRGQRHWGSHYAHDWGTWETGKGRPLTPDTRDLQ